jgi:hypothetical protein
LDALRIDIGTVRQWRSAGLTTAQFRSLARAGALVRCRQGVYVRAGSLGWAADNRPRQEVLRVAAVTAAQSARGAVASHQSAALIHGLSLLREPPDGVVWLTRPPGAYRGRSVAGVRFHSARLPPDHVTALGGVAVTTATRTVIDLARSLSFMEGVVVADSALRLGKTTDIGLVRMVRACARWPGNEMARKVVGFSTESSESVLESCARVFFAERGLPRPRLQVSIHGTDGRFIARADFYWDEYRTVGEADGMAKYDVPERARRDRLGRRRAPELATAVAEFAGGASGVGEEAGQLRRRDHRALRAGRAVRGPDRRARAGADEAHRVPCEYFPRADRG